MSDLKFGVNLYPHQWQDVTRIEEMGYDSAWTSEHTPQIEGYAKDVVPRMRS